MIRKNEIKYDPHVVLQLAKKARVNKKRWFVLDGDYIKAKSQRYFVFEKSLSCVKCGIVGAYFIKEKSVKREKNWHLNLYGITEIGQEILITKDHIIPHSKGGSDASSNFQTMCFVCNQKKGAHLEEDEII